MEKKEIGNIDLSASYFEKFYIPKDKDILDIGTNWGSFLNKIYQSGYRNITGIDIDHKAIEEGKKMYPHLESRLFHTYGKDIPYSHNAFDVITCFDTLEHIPDINFFIYEVYRVLKPGGIFIFQTPNKYINTIWCIIQNRSFTHHLEEHCSLQTKSSLKRKLAMPGFKDIRIEKHQLLSDFNENKLKEQFGMIAPGIISIVQKFPISIFPNLWGNAIK